MRIYFDYPLATAENMSAVQNAIDEGKSFDELMEIFDDEMLWDCFVVLYGYKDVTWNILYNLDGPEQRQTEDWQQEFMEEYLMDLREEKA